MFMISASVLAQLTCQRCPPLSLVLLHVLYFNRTFLHHATCASNGTKQLRVLPDCHEPEVHQRIMSVMVSELDMNSELLCLLQIHNNQTTSIHEGPQLWISRYRDPACSRPYSDRFLTI